MMRGMNSPKLRAASNATPLPSDVSGGAPPYIHLIPAGVFAGRDGRGPYLLDVEAVLSAFNDAAALMPLDYEHQSIRAADNGQPAPAAGWITELEARADGIWGKMAWTARGAAFVMAHEYKYVSPVFDYVPDADNPAGGRVFRLVSAALTNQPNLHLTALNRREAGQNAQFFTTKGSNMTLEELQEATETVAMKKELSLPEDADMIAILKAAHARLTASVAETTAESAELKLLRAEHKRVQEHIAALENEREDRRVAEAVEAALAAHKISPASRADAEALFRESPDAFQKFIAAQAPILPDSKAAQHARNPAKGSGGNDNPLVALSMKLKQEFRGQSSSGA